VPSSSSLAHSWLLATLNSLGISLIMLPLHCIGSPF
jgi:hypothetical protein